MFADTYLTEDKTLVIVVLEFTVPFDLYSKSEPPEADGPIKANTPLFVFELEDNSTRIPVPASLAL